MEKRSDIVVQFDDDGRIIVERYARPHETKYFKTTAEFVVWFEGHSEEEKPIRWFRDSPEWNVWERMMIGGTFVGSDCTVPSSIPLDCDWFTRKQPEPEVEAKKFEKVKKFEVDGPTIKPFDLAPLKREGVCKTLGPFSPAEPAPEPEPDPIAIAGMLIHRFKGAS